MVLQSQRLQEQIQLLTAEQLAEVEQFVEQLQLVDNTRPFAQEAALLSGRSFERVWNNPEDSVYDAI